MTDDITLGLRPLSGAPRAFPRPSIRTAAERAVYISARVPLLVLVANAPVISGPGSYDSTVIRLAAKGGANVIYVRAQTTSQGPGSVESHVLGAQTGMGVMVVGLAVRELDDTFLLVGGSASATAAAYPLGAGVHLPEALCVNPTTSPATLRQHDDASLVISCSVHSSEAAERAEAEGADMLVLGTVFPSRSHPGGPTIGLDGVREVCQRVHIPVVGIGGITAQNAADVIRAGASGVAVISAIFDAPDPRAAAAELRAAIDAAWTERKVT